ncbi:carbon-nitrogen hydrolase [Thozetella sp. PMI_491]|nr:carbon-nitrogen hydrolase [Thozetella sp. PMI_491]
MARFLRVAACHVSPVFLSAAKTIDKAVSLVTQASKNKASLVVFPETYVPAFPIWSSLRSPAENHNLFRRMATESVYVDGDEVRAIRDVAKQTGTLVSLGISEKVRHSSACLFNTNVLIGTDGEILVHHRKLVPTFFEKLTWSPGDGHGLRVAGTKFGKIGSLICGENTNPLARYSLMAQGEEVHISTRPAIWPTRIPEMASRDPAGGDATDTVSSKPVTYDNVTANRTRAAAHCFEAKCFGVLCAGYLGSDAIEIMTDGASNPGVVSEALRAMPRAATMFLDPTGALLPRYTINWSTSARTHLDFLQIEEGILYADMNLEDRLDVFDLRVNRSRRIPATFIDGEK